MDYETRSLEEVHTFSLAFYHLPCSGAQKLGPEVIMKMENVVWPHFGASLPCLFTVNAHSAPYTPTPSSLEES